MKKEEMRQFINETIEDALDKKFKSILADISYRIESLYAVGINQATGAHSKITASDMNTTRHMLDGFVIEDNKPIAGKIQWTDAKIVYKGITYTITDGSTDLKYVWWSFTATDKTKFTCQATKPVLTEDDVLVFVNDAGKHTTVLNQFTNGAVLLDGTVTGSEVKSGAIGKLNLATGAVDASKIEQNAVTSDKILGGAVTEAKIGQNAVTADKINGGAVTEAKIGQNAVTADKIGQSAVGTGAIAEGAVTGTKIGAGAVATDKLNLAKHLIF